MLHEYKITVLETKVFAEYQKRYVRRYVSQVRNR